MAYAGEGLRLQLSGGQLLTSLLTGRLHSVVSDGM